MSRTLSTAFNNALQNNDLRGVLLLEIQFDSGTQRFNTSPIDLSWNSVTWTSAGAWGSVSSTKESFSGEVSGMTVELNGLPPSLVSLALTEHVQGRKAILYFALLDSNYAFIIDPVIEFQGLCDVPVILDGREGKGSRVQLAIESRIVDFKRPNVKRWNSNDQKSVYPTDTFFDHVENMVDKQIVWPNKEYFKK